MRRAALIAIGFLAACSEPGVSPPGTRPGPQTQPLLALHATVPEHGAILIPRRAVVERTGIQAVFVFSDQQEARLRMVKVGRVRGDQVEILSGLEGSETLVLGDLSAVHDGTPITPN